MRAAHYDFWFGKKYLPQGKNCLLGLERLVVGELDDMWSGSEQGLIYVDLGVCVDGVIAYVEELDDLGFWELFYDAFAATLIFDQLAGNLPQETRHWLSQCRGLDWELTFFIDLIRGLADIPPYKERVLLFMLSECSLNFLYFQLLTLSSKMLLL